ncbi:MAG: HpcH/HpaI aldolase/citrate lyase family protein [Chloroflexi bacterium]|nr:HpcH/HpaI aldolase/citrate lyase family protein [Chloroflexota bacterium]
MNSTQNPRTLLFVPGNRLSMLKKAAGFDVEWLIPDLEDSVPFAEKIEARATVAENIPRLAAAGKRVVPRVNSLASGLAEDDIAAVVSLQIVGISIGKISTPEEVGFVEEMLATAEKKAGITVGHTSIVPWLETAEAVINAYQICKASKRIRMVAFGAEDYSADMGISRATDKSGGETGSESKAIVEPGLYFARSAVAIAARAAGVHALDTPFTKFRDPAGLRAEAMLAKSIGFKGKLAIHPAQVEVIESVFMPTESEIERARRVLDIAAEAEADGRGAVSLDGEMIDMPVILRAQNVLRDAGLSLLPRGEG